MRAILFCVISLLFVVACQKQAEPVVLELQDGNLLKSEAWQGKWVYINYWAVWCKPCAEEIPELNRYAANTGDAVVYGVNFDGAKAIVLSEQVNALRIEFPVVVSDIRKAFPHEVPQGLPATLVFNPEGKLVATLQGPQTVASLNAARNR